VIAFPELSSHIILLAGRVIDDNDLKAYQTSCVVDNNDPGPKRFSLRFTGSSRLAITKRDFDAAAIILYFTEFYQAPDEVRQATGDYLYWFQSDQTS
jgi:hypothetical protein